MFINYNGLEKQVGYKCMSFFCFLNETDESVNFSTSIVDYCFGYVSNICDFI